MSVFSKRQMAVSCVLKIVVIISAVLGTLLSAYAGRHSFMGGSRVLMFFTIQSNIAVAAVSAIGLGLMMRNKSISKTWWVIKFVVTVSITLTGVVFCFVLAPTLGNAAWNLQNILTHVVVPVAAITDFFAAGVSSDIRKRNTFWVIVPPVLYAVYAGIGYVKNWQFVEGYNYPYFFLNWGSPAGAFGFTDELPYMGCVWWILAIFAALLIVGYLYLAITDLLKKIRDRQPSGKLQD